MKKQKTYRAQLSFDLVLGDRSSLDIGHAGISMPLGFTQKMDKEIDFLNNTESFGIFGGSNNMNTFYPGLDIHKDVMPKPEDFIEQPFRLLSATTVGGGSWKATDFSNVAVLKASKDKLLGKPIYYDHDTDLPNWVGIVKSIKWSDAFTSDGVQVPGGIDGVLAIDAKTNPKIARGVLMKSIFSNSVTVVFDWVPSHTFENMYEFENRMGQRHDDGTMIRRVVTEIFDYHETSLVWLGADPFAKLIDEKGNLRNIDESAISYAKEDERVKSTYQHDKKFAISFGIDKNILALSRRKDIEQLEITSPMNEKILAQIAALVGVKASDLTVEHLSKLVVADPAQTEINTLNAGIVAALSPVLTAFAAEHKLAGPVTDHAEFFKTHGIIKVDALAKLKEDADKLPALTTQVEGLNTEIGTLKKDKEDLAKDATAGKKFVSMKRAETTRLYKLHVGGEEKADAAVLKLIGESEEDVLEGLLKQYVKDTTGKFSGCCTKCGSADFEFRSTVADNASTEGAEVIDETSVSRDEIYKKFAKSSITLAGVKKD